MIQRGYWKIKIIRSYVHMDSDMPTTNQPKWGPEHDAMVAKYEEKVKAGTIKEFVAIAKDTD